MWLFILYLPFTTPYCTFHLVIIPTVTLFVTGVVSCTVKQATLLSLKSTSKLTFSFNADAFFFERIE